MFVDSLDSLFCFCYMGIRFFELYKMGGKVWEVIKNKVCKVVKKLVVDLFNFYVKWVK